MTVEVDRQAADGSDMRLLLSTERRLRPAEILGVGSRQEKDGPAPVDPPVLFQASLAGLSAEQRLLLAVVGGTDTLGQAAEHLGKTPAALRARLWAIAARLGLASAAELIGMARRQHTLEASTEAFCVIDADGCCLFASAHLSNLLGYAPEELYGRDMHSLVHYTRPDGCPLAREHCALHSALVGQQPVWHEDQMFIRRDGSPIWVSVTVEPASLGDGRPGAVVGLVDRTVLDDLAYQAQRSDAHLRLALEASDSVAFEVDLATGRATASGAGEPSTVSHEQLVARVHPVDRHKVSLSRLRSLPPGSLVEEDLVMTSPRGPNQVHRSRFRVLADRHGTPRSVIGVAQEVAAGSASARAAELRDALTDGQVAAHYQPIVRMSDGQPVAVEALARWEHPRLGLLTPAEFIPAAEAAGLLPALDEEILAQACEQTVTWNFSRAMHHLPPLSVSVNVTAIELQDPNYPELLAASLRRTGLLPKLLWLEVTEETPITDWSTAERTVGRLRQMGVRLAIDDLGAGYSSLERLSRLTPTGLKLDARFVREVPTNSSASIIASAVALLAWQAGIRAVAEGVERPEQAEALRAMGWKFGQGYLWSPARSAKDLDALIVEGRRP